MSDQSTFTTVVVPVVSVVLGALGTFLGAWNFFQLRSINRRGKAPHFVFDHLLIDASGASGPPGSYVYSYSLIFKPLDGVLMVPFDQMKKLPSDYPRDRVVGVVAKNVGSKLRIFNASASEPIHFCESAPDVFELPYKHDERKPYREIVFVLEYETDDGFQGRQRWKLETGSFEFTRLEPKSVPKS